MADKASIGGFDSACALAASPIARSDDRSMPGGTAHACGSDLTRRADGETLLAKGIDSVSWERQPIFGFCRIRHQGAGEPDPERLPCPHGEGGTMVMRVGAPAGLIVLGLIASAGAAAQSTPPLATATATTPDAKVEAPAALQHNEGLLLLDYQVLRVAGDQAIDLMGLHVHHKMADSLYLGTGFYLPLVRGAYGGFAAFDVGAHVQHHLTPRIFATAGLSVGGGAGGRSIAQAKVLSGTGAFYKAYVGLGYDFGPFTLGANLAKMRFKQSSIDSTQANVFVGIPFGYRSGSFYRHGEPLTPAEAQEAAEAGGESTWSVVLDNFRQIDPTGSFKGDFNMVDLQYAHYIAPDTYWYVALGVGYRGLPIYNQVLGGLGHRLQLAPSLKLHAQLGIGSGGYSPDIIDTDAGLLVYPKLSAEYAVTPDLGLSLSLGYLAAPKGTSRNFSAGVGLNYRFGSGTGRASAPAGRMAELPRFQAFRVNAFQQTESGVRFLGLDRDSLQLIGAQVDAIVDDRWYLAVQGAIAYSEYLGNPGYGELLAGAGLQTRAERGDRWQVFGQLMAGTNVHGLAAKASGGIRYLLGETLGLTLTAGHIQARSKAGNRFTANTLALGLEYRFSLPTR
jgi:hypothetical protein